jgi:SWI/SNF-related matrix-associated actin-dependent regulator 1 of chromatin subfamily A
MAGLGGAGAGGWDSLDDDDDWGLTAEQFDKLEQDAYRALAERKASSSAASTAPITSPLPHRADAERKASSSAAPTAPITSPLPHRALSPASTASSPVRNEHPASRTSLESRFGKVRVSSALLLSRGVCWGFIVSCELGFGLAETEN